MYKKIFFCCLFLVNYSNDSFSKNEPKDCQASILRENLNKKKVIKILTIDGGGIRGIIPAYILRNIESRLKKRNLAECLDMIAGTSTGGIIALLLSTPDEEGKQKYTAEKVYKLYKNLGEKVFSRSLWQIIKSFNGWMEEKYSADDLEFILNEYFQSIKLSQLTTNVLIPTYDLESSKSIYFTQRKARKFKENDFYLKDIARATSAAPTYFKPAKIMSLNEEESIFIDGGVVSNNPSLNAYLYALELYGHDNEFLIISLGTGSSYGLEDKNILTESKILKGGILHWSTEITTLLMYSSNDMVDTQLNALLNKHGQTKYYRLEAILSPKHGEMDNVDNKNIEILESRARKIIYENEDKIQLIVEILENS